MLRHLADTEIDVHGVLKTVKSASTEAVWVVEREGGRVRWVGEGTNAGLLRWVGESPEPGLERSIWAVNSAGAEQGGGKRHTPHSI